MLHDRLTNMTKTAKNRALLVAGIGAMVALPGLVLQSTPAESPASQAAVPTMTQLEPTGIYGQQSHVDLTSEQKANAKKIVAVVNHRHLPQYAAVVSVATALQESKLQNLNVAVDYDSLGLFQQRPSCGWGTPDQLVDPQYATNAFLNALQQAAPNYQHMPLYQAAQTTQQSAFPEAYAQWQDEAARLVQGIVAERM